MPEKNKKNEPEIIGLIGVGLDGSDGHKRITQGEKFVIVGGSEQTHEKLQDVVIRFSKKLHKSVDP